MEEDRYFMMKIDTVAKMEEFWKESTWFDRYYVTYE
jgi:hypothetical protein